MPKFREIVIRPHVKLPPLSTEIAGREHSFLAFLNEWVLQARGMRKEESLPHLFEWEEAVDTFVKRMAEKAGAKEPKELTPLEVPTGKPQEQWTVEEAAKMADYQRKVLERQTKDAEAWGEYHTAVHGAAVGESLYVSDAAFKAAKESAKAALDEASTPDPMGRTRLPRPYEPKILRHYHAFSQALAIEEHDVPKPRPPAELRSIETAASKKRSRAAAG